MITDNSAISEKLTTAPSLKLTTAPSRRMCVARGAFVKRKVTRIGISKREPCSPRNRFNILSGGGLTYRQTERVKERVCVRERE